MKGRFHLISLRSLITPLDLPPLNQEWQLGIHKLEVLPEQSYLYGLMLLPSSELQPAVQPTVLAAVSAHSETQAGQGVNGRSTYLNLETVRASSGSGGSQQVGTGNSRFSPNPSPSPSANAGGELGGSNRGGHPPTGGAGGLGSTSQPSNGDLNNPPDLFSTLRQKIETHNRNLPPEAKKEKRRSFSGEANKELDDIVGKVQPSVRDLLQIDRLREMIDPPKDGIQPTQEDIDFFNIIRNGGLGNQQDLPYSPEVYKLADAVLSAQRARDSLPSTPGDTLAKTEHGTQRINGWATPEQKELVQRVEALMLRHDVEFVSQGHRDGGEPGRNKASHAERQALIDELMENPNSSVIAIGVNRDMCKDGTQSRSRIINGVRTRLAPPQASCRSFMEDAARAIGKNNCSC
jgi:hypothetical protein